MERNVKDLMVKKIATKEDWIAFKQVVAGLDMTISDFFREIVKGAIQDV
jgi:hypothetical protein